MRRRSIILAVALLASYAYFYEGGGWNQNTRFDLVRAIVERQTVRIDAYASNTGDRAEVDGHFYTDKAPGASLTAVPAFAVTRALFASSRRDLSSPDTIAWLSHVSTVAAAGVPAALAALCVFWLALRGGAGTTAAAVAAIVCGLGTPLWAYATLLYGHALAAGCLAAAVWGVVRLRDSARRTSDRNVAFWIGAAAGWAVVTEFPSAIPSALICAWVLWEIRAWDRARMVRAIAAMTAGLAVAAAILLTYNVIAFGTPFHIAYSSEEGEFEAMKRGLFGINWPSLEVAGEILLWRYRGLLPLAPVLIVAPLGWWLWLRGAATRAMAIVSIVMVAYYVVLTSGYAYWNGGWSYGSRHLGPALPFLALGLAPVWQRGGRLARAAVLALAIVSVGQSLVAVATTPQPDGGASGPRDPMREQLWPHFVSGEFPIGYQSVLERDAPREPISELVKRGVPRASWNIGEKLGLRGHASLLPLLAVWVGAWIAWWRTGRRNEAGNGV